LIEDEYDNAVYSDIDYLILDWPLLDNEEESQKLGFGKSKYYNIEFDFILTQASNNN